MRFEQIDKKIQEAAEKHHPAYDENAWQKMEKLLNEHLPVKKDDRRRVFLLLLIFLLIGGGGLLLLSKPGNKKSDIAAHGNNQQLVNEKKPQSENASVSGSQLVNPNSGDQNKSSREPVAVQDNESTSQSTNSVRHDLTRNRVGNTTQTEKSVTSNAPATGDNISARNIDQNHQSEPEKEISAIQNPTESKQDENVRHEVPQSAETKTEAAQTTATQTAKHPIHHEKSSWLSGFALLFSAGPDVSKAGGSDLGKVTLAYGAGISYTKNRFTLRTGIYAARKIYTAGPSDYKMSYQSSYVKFVGADADCYVIEIPVGLYYNFASKNKSNWFAGAGLSSYLMKTENYNYEFKTNTGTSLYRNYDVKNENKHYFSVLDLSAGYNLHLSKTVSLSAEPYFKIPLSGIGVGKVQLNSAGVLFTLGIKPFK